MMESTINERIRLLVDKCFNGNTSAMARATLIRQSTLRDIIGERQSAPSYDTIKAIVDCAPLEVNVKWLITGNGSMFKENPNKDTSLPVVTQETRPRIPYTAAAGSLTHVMEGVTEAECEQIPVVGTFPTYDFSIFVKGDSMFPRFESGDEVACKKISDTHFIQWGKVHVLDTAQGIIMKRIYEDGNRIRCVSYNPEYPDFSIPKEEIYSINLVVGLLRV